MSDNPARWGILGVRQLVDIYSGYKNNDCGGLMKRVKDIKEVKAERPRRAIVSEKEASKRMKEFSKRREKFIATVRAGKS